MNVPDPVQVEAKASDPTVATIFGADAFSPDGSIVEGEKTDPFFTSVTLLGR
jgi:hypothetical protein